MVMSNNGIVLRVYPQLLQQARRTQLLGATAPAGGDETTVSTYPARTTVHEYHTSSVLRYEHTTLPIGEQQHQPGFTVRV